MKTKLHPTRSVADMPSLEGYPHNYHCCMKSKDAEWNTYRNHFLRRIKVNDFILTD
jgi:hypothetical protein